MSHAVFGAKQISTHRRHQQRNEENRSCIMLYTLAVVLVVLWLLGFSFHVAGGLIHLILVIAVILLVIQLLTGRRGV